MKQDVEMGCDVVGDVPSLGCLAKVVANVIEVALSLLGVIAVLFLLWGAIRFVTSQGDPKGIQEAQKIITYALIGTVVVFLTFFIINFFLLSFGFQTAGLPSILQNFSFYVNK